MHAAPPAFADSGKNLRTRKKNRGARPVCVCVCVHMCVSVCAREREEHGAGLSSSQRCSAGPDIFPVCGSLITDSSPQQNRHTFRVNYLIQVFAHTNNRKLKESRGEDLGRPFRDEPLLRSVAMHRSEEERINHLELNQHAFASLLIRSSDRRCVSHTRSYAQKVFISQAGGL